MTANDIRNICLLGHGGSGKTSLVESMLYMTGAIDRLGKTADGNTVCDYDAEEIKRQISISLALAPVKYQGVKINVLDAPGNFDFAGECSAAIRAAEVRRAGVRRQGRPVRGPGARLEDAAQKKPRMIYIQGGRGGQLRLRLTCVETSGKYRPVIAPIVGRPQASQQGIRS